jgi:hypothetical protein
LIVFGSCSFTPTYFEYQLEKPNPVSYSYNFSIGKIKEAIAYEFVPEKDTLIPEFYLKGGTKIKFSPTHYLDKLEDTLELHPLNDYLRSKIFTYEDGEVIPYHVVFKLILKSLGDELTKIEVKTINPWIITENKGFSAKFLGCFVDVSPKVRVVEPSTIEEYQILMRIGKRLGIEKLMPQIVLPDSGRFTIREDEIK